MSGTLQHKLLSVLAEGDIVTTAQLAEIFERPRLLRALPYMARAGLIAKDDDQWKITRVGLKVYEGCPSCNDRGELPHPVNQDLFGAWSVEYSPCPDCAPQPALSSLRPSTEDS